MKTDLRIIKSKKAIEEAFIQLVELKGFANITVKEIAEKAVVNRNTIYLNYGSKEGILESIVKSSFIRQFGEFSIENYKNIGLNKRKINDVYNKLFSIIDENIELFRIILMDTASIGYLEQELYKFRKSVMNLFKITPNSNAIINFFISGVWGIIRFYIIYADVSQEEAIKLLTDLTVVNLRQLHLNKKTT